MSQQVKDGAAHVCPWCGTEFASATAAAYCCLTSD